MLNPDNNLYSVAPVGHVVVIGRQAALKGGITRDSAINLLTWLILSTNAKPDEIAAAIAKAMKPSGPIAPAPVPIVSRFQVPAPVQAPTLPLPVAGQNVAAFMGEIDPEEQQALDEVNAACQAAEANQPAAAPPAPATAQPAAAPPAPVVALPVRTAAPVPTTPARAAGAPVMPPVPVVVAGMPTKPAGAVDETETAKAWGVTV